MNFRRVLCSITRVEKTVNLTALQPKMYDWEQQIKILHAFYKNNMRKNWAQACTKNQKQYKDWDFTE